MRSEGAAEVETRSDCSAVERALAWIDAATAVLEAEMVPLGDAAGRVVAEDARTADPIPAADRAALDGFAVRAQETTGAGVYNPLSLDAGLVAAGDAMPAEADAVIPLQHAQTEGDRRVIVVEPIIAGANVERRGAVAEAGAVVVRAGTRLAPQHLGLLALAGPARLPLVRRPRVRVAVIGSVPLGAAADGDAPMVRAAVERDGGDVTLTGPADAFAPGVDIVLTVGGTGPGRADRAAAALAACGELAIHGLALRPGDSTGFGHTAEGIPVLLLPGAPVDCLFAYELFGGRAVRRLAGGNPQLPFRRCRMMTARKIVSEIGTTEICAMRCRPDGLIEPIASVAEIGLMAAVEADGFVVVPAASEGYPAGTSVDVHLYGGSREALR